MYGCGGAKSRKIPYVIETSMYELLTFLEESLGMEKIENLLGLPTYTPNSNRRWEFERKSSLSYEHNTYQSIKINKKVSSKNNS